MKMFPKEKLDAVRNYLKDEFPGYAIDDQYETNRMTQTFRLEQGNKIHLVTVSREFLDDRSAARISIFLKLIRLSEYFQSEKVSRVIVTSTGIKTEKA